ncbi:MAG: DNA primase [Candidatus Levybacteria bacterium]|nr:DNA primase [Candidatus Levybacteria bacterium]
MDQSALIREKLDIISFISEFIPLKKTGRNFKTNCPFHTEKTPSFVVSPERQIWHCFGCSKGGDIYTFLMEYERLEFPEALRILAQRAGIALKTTAFDTAASSKKEKIYHINALASEFYHYILTKHSVGKKAAAYLHNRKIDQRVWETFKIGFAPNVGNGLSHYLIEKKQYTPQDLVDAGLAYIKGRDVVDFFRGRVIFPLIDHRDNVVGFSGRTLTEADSGPKYINTRETLVYHKGDMFFGLHIAKEPIRQSNQALLVEGEFDVMSCFQAGIPNALAIKGTALTENQVNLLARYAQKVTVCFDGDKAGQEALKRSLSLLEKKHLTTTVLSIPSGKDPDDAIRTDPYAFKHALKHDSNVYDYLLERALLTHNGQSAEGKKAIADELLPLFLLIDNEIIKEHYMRKLSSSLSTSYESLQKEIQRREKKAVESKKVFVKVNRSREEILEEYLASLIIQAPAPKDSLEKAIGILTDSLSKERAYQKILHHLLMFFDTNQTFDGKRFGDGLPSELLEAYNKSFLTAVPQLADQDKYLIEVEKTALQLQGIYLKDRMKKIALEIKEKEKQDQDTEELEIMYSLLASKLKNA